MSERDFETGIDESEDGPSTWDLRHGEELLATLEEVDSDFPWVECRFIPTSSFERYRHYFVREGGVWRNRAQELFNLICNEGISLTNCEGHRLIAFTVVVQGDFARLTFTPV